MSITKNKRMFELFEKNYWQYFLELEEQFISTKRYVAFEKANFKTFSIEYLKLLEAVCSEIDVVGKEIAHQIDTSFRATDPTNNIQKWWYVIQDWVFETEMEPVTLLNELEFNPWNGYRVEHYTDSRGAVRLRLAADSRMPRWWTSYNKVKHNRTMEDPETQEKFFTKANLENVCEAFTALYILEKRYMMSVGKADDYNRVQTSRLFENTKPRFYYDEEGGLCQINE